MHLHKSTSARERFRTPRILVVDDHPDTRSILTEVLVKRGFRVETAESAGEALDKAKAWKPDLAIVDLVLPGGDGCSLVARLKEVESTRGLPLVAYTAHIDPEIRERAERAGCDAVLTKPIPSAELVATLEPLLPPDTRPAVEGADPGPDDTWTRLRELRRAFREALPRRIQRLAELWEEVRDSEPVDEVRRDVLSVELHRLAGSAATYGLPELSRSAGKLSRTMDRWRSRPLASVRRRADRLMEEVQDEVRRWSGVGRFGTRPEAESVGGGPAAETAEEE